MVTVRILILTNYFYPDFGAGAFRMMALVEAINSNLPDDLTVDIFTTQPNRYGSLKVPSSVFDDYNWLTVQRIKVAEHKGTMASQAICYSKFFLKTYLETRNKKYDLIFATSSRLFTGLLGALIAKSNRAKLYLDIRDLFVDTLGDLFAGSQYLKILPFLKLVEMHTLKSADRINIVSAGFEKYICERVPAVRVDVITNGIDEEFIVDSKSLECSKNEGLNILYAGNLGSGQSIETIVPLVAQKVGPDVKFKLFGAGARVEYLKQTLLVSNSKNVTLYPPISRQLLKKEYANADALFLHLNDIKAFEKVLPSKIFEYAASGKPIIAGVSGHAANFLASEIEGVHLFQPGDVDQLLAIIRQLKNYPSHYDRSGFIAKFKRKTLMTELWKIVLSELET